MADSTLTSSGTTASGQTISNTGTGSAAFANDAAIGSAVMAANRTSAPAPTSTSYSGGVGTAAPATSNVGAPAGWGVDSAGGFQKLTGAVDSMIPAQQEVNDQMNKVNQGLLDVANQIKAPQYKTLQDHTADFEKERQRLTDLYSKQQADINTQYANREVNQATVNRLDIGAQAQTLANLGALGTGSSGASYLKAVSDSNQFQLNALTDQRNSVLLQAQAAYQAQDFQLLKEKNAEADRLVEQYNQIQSQMFADSMTLAQNTRAEALAKIQVDKAESERIATDVVPALYQAIQANPSDSDAIIKSYVDKGINPTTLASQLATYKTTQDTQNILNATNTANLLAKTAVGGTLDVPGLGKVTILGQNAQAPTTLKAGGMVYNWSPNSQSWVSTGLKDTELTPDNILKFAELFGDSSIAADFAKSLGIDVSLPGDKVGGSVSWRNNNPGNIKYGDFAEQYGAKPGTSATDGGVFANFPDEATGFQAMKDLLRSPSYANLSLDAAMKRWSNGGYGSNVTATSLRNKTTGQMTEAELQGLAEDMVRREGWKEGTIKPTSGTPTGATAIAQNIMDPTSSMTLKDVLTKDKPAVEAALAILREEAIASGNIEGVIKASAGGTSVGDTFLTSFEKGLNVISQIDDLQNQIDGEATGPITGLIRSNNPYDTKAQLIKSQLQAIVPNLARGVYGEVGVLTDNDIKLYSKTLPTLTSTEEIRNAVLGIAVKTVQRSLENKLKTQANAGRDVSGFADTYKQVKALAESIEPKIKVKEIASGATGSIPYYEFDEKLYERIK